MLLYYLSLNAGLCRHVPCQRMELDTACLTGLCINVNMIAQITEMHLIHINFCPLVVKKEKWIRGFC